MDELTMDTELWTAVLQDGAFAAVAAVGFGMISNPPKRAIYMIALLGAVGHACRYGLLHGVGLNLSVATFLASMTIGLLSVFLAKLIRCPAEIMAFPALLPMIPGMYAYKTVLALMKFMLNSNVPHSELNDYIIDIFRNGLTTIFVMCTLVIGMAVPLLIFKKVTFTRTKAK